MSQTIFVTPSAILLIPRDCPTGQLSDCQNTSNHDVRELDGQFVVKFIGAEPSKNKAIRWVPLEKGGCIVQSKAIWRQVDGEPLTFYKSTPGKLQLTDECVVWLNIHGRICCKPYHIEYEHKDAGTIQWMTTYGPLLYVFNGVLWIRYEVTQTHYNIRLRGSTASAIPPVLQAEYMLDGDLGWVLLLHDKLVLACTDDYSIARGHPLKKVDTDPKINVREPFWCFMHFVLPDNLLASDIRVVRSGFEITTETPSGHIGLPIKLRVNGSVCNVEYK